MLVLTAVVLAFIFFPRETPITYPHGILVEEYPTRFKLEHEEIRLIDDYVIKSLAGVKIKARVLGKEGYSFDRESDIAPFDLALGWGPMSDEAILSKLEITQGRRWYHWKKLDPSIDNRTFIKNSSNMHMIPSSEEIEDILDQIIVGNLIAIEGYLVEVKATDNWKWKSSMSWEDTGGGACELVYIEKLKILR
jgi:hypothetical protein